ncbi:MAG: PIN domain-containing protein [Rhodoferax sp.]
MSTVKAFIDTNVLVYWVDSSSRADTVEALLAQQAVVSVQVLNEFANVLRKKRRMPWSDIRALTDTLARVCTVYDLGLRTHRVALDLAQRYSLSFYDACIVAAAGLSACEVLYSEDMQHGLNIQLPDNAGTSSLSIRNPFIEV